MIDVSSSRSKVLIAHNIYQQAGGEDSVVANERVLLEEHGHEVSLYQVDNKSIDSIYKKISAAINTSYSVSAKNAFLVELKRQRPDVVHVHNFFPLLTPSIYDACVEVGVPIVQTLHNYRLICPNGLLLRDGKICELCVTGSAYHGTRYACYRDSHVGSFFVSRMVQYHRKSDTWSRKVDRYIALTDFARLKFIQGGFPKDKICIKPNFYLPSKNYESPKTFDIDTPSSYALYVGRLSEEKGIKTLIEAWKHIDYPLHVAGTGPLLDMIRQQHNPNITCLGQISADDIHHEMMGANFLLLPSEWYEGFPMVIVESFAHGLPVIASCLGSMAEIIDDHKTGLHFEPGRPGDLADKVNALIRQPKQRDRMARNAYNVYKKKYTPEINYQMLLNIYSEAIKAYALHHSNN